MLPAQVPQVPAVPVAVAQVQGPAPVAVHFALAPALVSNTTIDYSTVTGQKLYTRAVMPLAPAFDMQPENLTGFLQRLNARAMSTGWIHILEIPPDLTVPGTLFHLAVDYGQLSLAQVMAHAATYVAGQTRAAQDSMQLYHCIIESLTKEALDKVMLFANQFTTQGFPSGTGLLRVVIRESGLDTLATTAFIRARLSSLDNYMTTVQSDIPKFNLYVQKQVAALHARGATTEDLLTNLFKGYLKASDKEFRTYITTRQEEYFDGRVLDHTTLMQLALNKYKTMFEAGTWNAPSDEEIKIIALEARLEKMVKARKSKGGGTNEGTNANESKSKDKEGNKSYKKKEKPAWKSQKPKEGEAKKKTVDNKDWHWCPKHEAWVAHLPSECLGKGVRVPPKKQDAKGQAAAAAKGGSEQATLKLSQALAAIQESS